jgi:hypothetical protein
MPPSPPVDAKWENKQEARFGSEVEGRRIGGRKGGGNGGGCREYTIAAKESEAQDRIVNKYMILTADGKSNQKRAIKQPRILYW